jgi:alpha-tubulin suppressor-like RCC1 family protein
MLPDRLWRLRPRRMIATSTAILAALGLALACSEDQTPTGPPELKTGVTPLTVAPASLQFGIPPLAPATITAKVQFVGLITASSSNTNCATVAPASVPATKPPGSSVYVATFTVTPVAVGSCTITVTDKKGEQARMQVQVQASIVHIRHETLVAGEDHTCGLTSDGTAYCWGANASGQLGDGSTSAFENVPTKVSGTIAFTSLAGGGLHTCGLTSEGVAYCWGSNIEGQLGDGSTTDRTTPTAVSGGLRFVSVTAGHGHTCGLTSVGKGYCWGRHFEGQLGNGSTADLTAPAEVSGDLGFAALVAGGFHTCGLTGAGKAYCWGDNLNGQVGDGTTETLRTEPVAVATNLSFTTITAGAVHSCALISDGAGYCWGENSSAELGEGTATTTAQPTPTAMIGSLRFASLSVGSWNHHTCGLTAGGAAYCWGYNLYGQVGDGTGTTPLGTATAVSGDFAFASIATASVHTCGITTGGVAYCWGYGQNGELGDGTNTGQHVPTAVSGNLTFATP